MGAVRSGAARSSVIEWIFAGLVLAVGVANLLFVNPVPAMAYGLISLVYVPPANALLRHRFGISIHTIAKVALGIAIVMFTLGVSDFGDMID